MAIFGPFILDPWAEQAQEQKAAETGQPDTNKNFTLAARFRVQKDTVLYRLY